MADLELRKQRHPSFVPCRDYIFAMLLLIGMASYLYGLRVVILAAVSLATSIACDLLACLMRRTRWELTDLSSEMFALMYTLMLPASIGYGVAMLGTAVTVLLGKHAFGGYNCYPFHPAAFGFAFVSVCVGDALYQYPRPFSEIGLGLQSGAQLYSGVAQALRQGGVPNVDTTDLLLGQYAGPMGTTFCLIILSCLMLLIARGTVSWQIPTSYLLVCALWAFAFPRIQTTRLLSVVYEMLSGAIIFSAVFIASVPSLSPQTKWGKVAYGVTMGLFTMFYRTVGIFEMGVCFAALFVNPLAPWFDRLFAKKTVRMKGGKRRKR